MSRESCVTNDVIRHWQTSFSRAGAPAFDLEFDILTQSCAIADVIGTLENLWRAVELAARIEGRLVGRYWSREYSLHGPQNFKYIFVKTTSKRGTQDPLVEIIELPSKMTVNSC